MAVNTVSITANTPPPSPTGASIGLEEKTSQSGVTASEESVVVTDAPKTGKENRLNLGLRVVSRPEKVLEAIKEQPIEEIEEAKGDEKEYYKEKVHRFTPIYTPPAEAKEETAAAEAKEETTTAEAKEETATATASEEKSDSEEAVEGSDSEDTKEN